MQLLRLEPDEVEDVAAEVRRRIREEGHRRARWWVPASLSPAAREELEQLGIAPDTDEPVLTGMIAAHPPPPGPGEVEARQARTLDEWCAGLELELEAFGLDPSLHEELRAAAERRYAEEHLSGQAPRFLAFVDGDPVATAVAITASRGLFLVGGATRAADRGRGAYRALVRARWDFAVERGTPGLVVTAGRHSRPILDRLGFEPVATTYLHVDSTL